MTVVQFTIFGEPASKGNSRIPVLVGGKMRLIKSRKGNQFASYMAAQCPVLPVLMEGDVRVDILIYYASRRPDLDESLILDGMSERIYKNDRQVKEKHVYWGLDRDNPRSVIRVTPVQPNSIPQWLVNSPEFTDPSTQG